MKMVFIFLLPFLYCCKQPAAVPQVTTAPLRVDECESLYKYFRENWIRHETGFYGFKGDSTAIRQIRSTFNKVRNKCFVGFDRKEIYNLFGESSVAYISNDSFARVEYHLNENCKKGVSGCVKVKIHIDPRKDTVFEVLPLITERVDY